MNRRTYLSVWLVAVMAASGSPAARAQIPVERQFAVVLDLLPADVRAGATLLLPGDTGLVPYRAGDNRWECIGDTPGDRRFSATCYHRSLGPFLAHQRALSVQGLRGSEFRERLCEDVSAGVVALPDRALIVDVTGALRADGGPPDSVTAYHLFQLPYATEEEVGLTDQELSPGAPWLHHAGTCDAHIMWSQRRAFPPP